MYKGITKTTAILLQELNIYILNNIDFEECIGAGFELVAIKYFLLFSEKKINIKGKLKNK